PFGNKPQFFLLLKPFLPKHIITRFITVYAFFNPFGRSMHRQMGSIMRHIQKHRLTGRMLPDKTDCRIGNGCSIIIIVRQFGDSGQVIVQRRRFIITPPAMQTPVITVESALYGITPVRLVKCPVYRDMPFPAHIGTVTVGFHYFGNRGELPAYLPPVSGTMLVHSRHPSHTGLMLVTSRQQGGTAGTTSSRILELAETYSVHSQAIYMRSLDFTAVTTQIGEPHVVT